MAEIHVQARKHARGNPAWMWTWVIIGILIIAAVVYYVYQNKDRADANHSQDMKIKETRRYQALMYLSNHQT